LIRPCREGEAIGIAAGLLLGGARPVVVIQCTGLFEAGDALRNVVHDLRLPLKLIVGVRSYRAHAAGKSADNCPAFTEPILHAWQIPYALLADPDDAGFGVGIRELASANGPRALLLGE
jgi:sulfopyruvate decarboxylase TPP-binding subunit